MHEKNWPGPGTHPPPPPQPPPQPPPPAAVAFDELVASTLAFASTREIGRGGCARVFIGQALPSLPNTPGPLAVKRLTPGGQQGERELLREVKILSRCSHPNLLPILGYCVDARGLCLVYPIASGGNLEDRLMLTAEGCSRLQLLSCTPLPMPWQTRCRVLCETLRALTYLHNLSTLHLDVKPSNILLDERCHARLADAGLAKMVEGSSSSATHMTTNSVRGTPAFLCPIYLRTQEQSELTDGFAMGITILKAVTCLPDKNLVSACRHMLRNPGQHDRWQAPGVPDTAAGEWPPHVVQTLLDLINGLRDEFKEDRMPLPTALRELEAIVEAADEARPSQQPTPGHKPEVHGPGAVYPKECMICLDQPRQVRFSCGQ